ncbi:hypothetical protein [Nannocystis punicea]|uniref:DUF4347 domain-containing protein n=1 Tax=Nannocystis punicea TaxID=2995304 RepID=A0ABY7HCV6_9BACT|nr:hypothetical protein [Nannocystis poenicansa]WAS96932.1 hypothetical protein O0S08_12350 [Nannocystis poenicansa]
MRRGPLRLMLFDRTCTGKRLRPGLSHAWWAGSHVYRGLSRFDASHGVSCWEDGLEWLATTHPDREIAEIQYWGHGHWGELFVDRKGLTAEALLPTHPLHRKLEAIRERMVPEHLWWFRTCEAFGAVRGQEFARRFTDFFGGRAAGHTYIIGIWQSGLHSLRAGEVPTWSTQEGLSRGTAESPVEALWSRRREPNTIHFLNGKIPEGY